MSFGIGKKPIIKIDGKTAKEWSVILGISDHTIRSRYRRGLSVDQILNVKISKPKEKNRSKLIICGMTVKEIAKKYNQNPSSLYYRYYTKGAKTLDEILIKKNCKTKLIKSDYYNPEHHDIVQALSPMARMFCCLTTGIKNGKDNKKETQSKQA